MRTVYRVEHEEHGHGPYLKPDNEDPGYSSAHWEIDGLHDAHEASKAHPGPRQDGLGWDIITDSHVHGFDSRELLDKWFSGFKRKLHEAGYVIRVFEAPEQSTFTSDSGKQTIFIKHLSRVVDTLPVVR